MNEHGEEEWILRVENLTKIYGEPGPHSLELTGPVIGSNICPQTDAIVACLTRLAARGARA